MNNRATFSQYCLSLCIVQNPASSGKIMFIVAVTRKQQVSDIAQPFLSYTDIPPNPLFFHSFANTDVKKILISLPSQLTSLNLCSILYTMWLYKMNVTPAKIQHKYNINKRNKSNQIIFHILVHIFLRLLGLS